MEAWARGEGDHWQAELWRVMTAGQRLLHPALRHAEFTQRFRAAAHMPASLPERISIFGISALPPFYLEFLSLLSERLPVHLFLLQPSEKYWGDITSAREDERLLRQSRLDDVAAFELHLETGNRLLASLGYLGRDFLKLLLETGNWIHQEGFEPVKETSLLRCIQSDILQLNDRGSLETSGRKHQTILAASDDSIQIHSCHSPLREMEVLYDHLLDWFQRDASLAPRDIVVMVPDVTTYAPFVQAVFGSPEDEAKRIPFSIADRGTRRECHLVETFLHLLQLPQTRLGAATVLAPLEAAAVRDRFKLSEQDLGLIRRWMEETRICWGIDAEHRRQLGLPALEGNTWRAGLDRLLLGYAMSGEGEHLFAGKLPYSDLEGGNADVLGRFTEYLETLFRSVADLACARHTLEDWATVLRALLDCFFEVDDASEREAQVVRGALRELERQQQLSGFEDTIPLAVLLERLLPRLEEDPFGSGFLAGGVTFCGLKPMRSIPFKVICLVGMNDNAFPRPAGQLSFDLMAKEPRLGDRSTREDDRYLFLETLLSARDRLYLSYVGPSIRDHAEAPPSVLIGELLDYVEQGFERDHQTRARRETNQRHDDRSESLVYPKIDTIRDRLITHHRLQAFSNAYFKPDGRLFSYSTGDCRASRAAASPRHADSVAFFQQPIGEPGPEFRCVSLSDLAEFFVNPARFLLRRRLRLRLRDVHDKLTEREPFTLDALEGYQLREDLVARHVNGRDVQAVFPALQAAGQLPLGRPGEAAFEANDRLAREFARRVREEFNGEFLEPIPFERTLGEFQVAGTIGGATGPGLLRYRCANIKAADLLRLWIPHLAANVLRPATPSNLIGLDETLQLRPCANAAPELERLLELYWLGLRAPLRFFPESAQAFADAARGSRDSSDSRPFVAARAVWEGRRFHRLDIAAEKDNPYFNLCFRHADPLDAEFSAHARAVFDPILDHLHVKNE
jgi:exodeoxyribonuclease V gamma subunit